MGKRKGAVKEVLGAVTGDRQVEAEGRAEQDEPTPTEQKVDEEVRAVREDHHDVLPEG
jgi:uncharacterized protein YjbJ (UPF0337 family)